MYIKVRVTASAKKESFVQQSEDHFSAAVKEPAKMNRANKRVIELLSHHFGVPTTKIRLIGGHHSPGKIFDILA